MALPSGQIFAYCKGAPEKLGGRCEPATMPADYATKAADYALNGCYVLGLAYKELREVPPQGGTAVRDELESGLQFISLLLFRNELKPCSVRTVDYADVLI